MAAASDPKKPAAGRNTRSNARKSKTKTNKAKSAAKKKATAAAAKQDPPAAALELHDTAALELHDTDDDLVDSSDDKSTALFVKKLKAAKNVKKRGVDPPDSVSAKKSKTGGDVKKEEEGEKVLEDEELDFMDNGQSQTGSKQYLFSTGVNIVVPKSVDGTQRDLCYLYLTNESDPTKSPYCANEVWNINQTNPGCKFGKLFFGRNQRGLDLHIGGEKVLFRNSKEIYAGRVFHGRVFTVHFTGCSKWTLDQWNKATAGLVRWIKKHPKVWDDNIGIDPERSFITNVPHSDVAGMEWACNLLLANHGREIRDTPNWGGAKNKDKLRCYLAKGKIPADIAMKVQCKLSDVLPAERNDYLSMMGFDSSLADIKPSAARVNADSNNVFRDELEENDDTDVEQSSGDAELQNMTKKLDGVDDPNPFDSDDDEEA